MRITLLIRKKRMEKGMTQLELADLLGVTQGAVMKWETGRCLPSLERMIQISHIFDCSIDELLVTQESI